MKIYVGFDVTLNDEKVENYKKYFEMCDKGFRDKFKDVDDFIAKDIYSAAKLAAYESYYENIKRMLKEEGVITE